MRLSVGLLLILAYPCFAHEDTFLTIEGTELMGLPTEYQPASYDRETMTLRIRSNAIVFPPCTLEHFDFMNNESLYITASWYHSAEVLPPYLGLGRKGDMISSMLIDLDTLELIENEFIGLPTLAAEECLSAIVSGSARDT